MTVLDVIERAWLMVGDVQEPRRNPLEQVKKHLVDGIRDLLSRRPHIRLTELGTLNDVVDDDDGDLEGIPDEYREGLAHYIAYRIFELDELDENNRIAAQSHQTQYIQRT